MYIYIYLYIYIYIYTCLHVQKYVMYTERGREKEERISHQSLPTGIQRRTTAGHRVTDRRRERPRGGTT